MSQEKLLKWAEDHVYYRKGYSGKHYSEFVCHIMNMFDKRVDECDCCCEWASPYGWVPEDGCKIHDR